MPSTSKKQHNFMAAIANNKAFAEKVHIPQKVGRDFMEADKGKKFKKGGDTMATMTPAMARRAAAMMAARQAMAPAAPMGMKNGGMKKMAKGGETMGPKSMSEDIEKGSNKLSKFGESAVQKKGHTKGKNLGDSGKEIGIEGGMKKGGKVKKMASGGMTSSRADGIAVRGKTKTKYC